MPPKQPFTEEPVTKPATRRPPAPGTRTCGAAPKDRRTRAEAPTMPPPNAAKDGRSSRPPPDAIVTPTEGRISGLRARKPTRPLTSAATVDEVVADLSNDPRRESDNDDDDDDDE
jgi:hypothetical protein